MPSKIVRDTYDGLLVRAIIAATAIRFGVGQETVIGKHRAGESKLPRDCAILAARKCTGLSYVNLASALDIDRGTVAAAIARAKTDDTDYRDHVAVISRSAEVYMSNHEANYGRRMAELAKREGHHPLHLSGATIGYNKSIAHQMDIRRRKWLDEIEDAIRHGFDTAGGIATYLRERRDTIATRLSALTTANTIGRTGQGTATRYHLIRGEE